MQTITVNLNLSRGSCRINQPLYLGETVALSFTEAGAYSLILTEPFADSPKDGIVVWAQSTATGELSLNRKALHSAFKKAEAMQPNMTISAKCFVISEDGQTVADGEVAIEYSPKAFVIDDEDYPLAREVLAQAEAAKNSAVSAKTGAEEAKSKAQGAQSAAEKAKDEARSARNEAKEAKTAAEKALSAAKESAATSSTAREGAITAQNESEAARDAAQKAQKAAEEARDNAETIASDTATKLVEASEKRLQNQIFDKVDKEPFNALAQKVNTVVGEDTGKSARTIAAEEVAKVVANAPADLDTLKEIADYIESDKTGAAQMVTQIDANAKAISAEEKRAQGAEAALNKSLADKAEKKEVELSFASVNSSLNTKADASTLAEEVARAKEARDLLMAEINKLIAGKLDIDDLPAILPPPIDLSPYATKEELSSINDLLDDKADTDKVWLRGGDVTGETNYAKSIKVNEISALDDEVPGSSITLNGNVDLIEDGWVLFTGYDDYGDYGEHSLDYKELMFLFDNSRYVQENLRGHITHDEVYDEWAGGTYGTITITPVTHTDWGEYESSDFYFSSNGNLTMSGTFRCYGSEGSGGGVIADWISCTYDVMCNSVYSAYGVTAHSMTNEWGEEYGGVIVRDEYSCDTVSSLLGGMLRIGDKYYSDCVEITVATGDLSLLFCHQDEELTFSFSDFATLRTMIDEYNASHGA